MEKVLFRPLIFCILSSLVILSSCNSNKKTETQLLKIGADFTLTGNLSYWSTELKKGMDLAVEEIDSTSGKQIKIIYEDNEFKAAKAVSIFNKFATIDKVDVVVSCFTPIGQSLRPSAEKFKIPLIATVTSAKDFSLTNNWTFRDFPTQDQQCPTIAEYAFNNLGLKKGVILVIDDDYGRDGANEFYKTFTSLGGVIQMQELFSQSDIDARDQIIKLLNKDPEFIFIIARDQALATACRQVREQNKSIQILGVNAFDASIVWELAGASGEGIIFTSGLVDFESNDVSRNFYNNYLSKYNETPNYVSVYGYSICKYVCNILLKTGNNSEAIQKELENLNTSSIRGKLVMDKERNVISPIGLYKRENGKTVLLK